MKVTAVATEKFTHIDGHPARVWKARTESGVEFLMFVARCAVPEGADCSQFEAELKAMPAPVVTPLAQVFDPQLFLN